MDKKYKELYIVELLMLILYLVSKFIFVKYQLSLSQYVDLFFYFICFLVFYFRYGLPRNKNYLNRISVRYIIILLLLYVLVIYLLGCFTGFSKSIYDHSVLGILINTLPVIVTIFCKEEIRASVSSRSTVNKKPIILLTIGYIVMDAFNSYLNTSIINFYQLFNFICLSILPSITRECLCSYISVHISILPTLIYRLSLEIVPILVPIYPDLGNYLNASIHLLFPFFIYLVMKKIILYKEKATVETKRYILKLTSILGSIFFLILIALVSGIFQYKMIAIGSDSMNPVYERGDAVIYEKKNAQQIKKGDILVFKRNQMVVTHRVQEVIQKNHQLFFQTKGDHNEKTDSVLVSQEDVLGTVQYIVKYIGYPTIWFNETF